jgi:hypothetical protein
MTLTDSDAPAASNGRGKARSEDDSIDLLPSGKIRAGVAGVTHTLRAPTLGEFRHLRELGTELDSERQARVEQSGAGYFEDFASVVAWLRAVFDELSDQALPDADDDLPTWFTSAELIGEMTQHWRTRPSGRGSR